MTSETTQISTPAGADPQLWRLVEIWRQAAEQLLGLLGELEEADWAAATELPGWDVKAIASHCAAVESSTIGRPEPRVDIGEPAHVTNALGRSVEVGVVNRRDHRPEQIINEFRTAVAERYDGLRADPPTDPEAPATGHFGSSMGWDTRLLLTNRPFDLWMHQQDIRRALGRPGNLHTAPGDHVTAYLLNTLGMVLGKRAGATQGQSLVFVVDQGSAEEHRTAVEIGEDGRGRPTQTPPERPTVTISTDRETFIRLSGGRGAVADDLIRIDGDQELGRRIVAGMAVVV